MSEFIHLHNHTDFSLLDGAASIGRYISKCKQWGMEHLAITDHGNMFGAIDFYKACKKAGINPLVGCEFYIDASGLNIKDHNSKNNHLILIAMDNKGYHNLMELNSIAYVEGYYYKPRIDREVLASHSEGLICLSACLAGELAQALLNDQNQKAQEVVDFYKNLFGDRYYIELQDHFLSEDRKVLPLLYEIAQKNHVKCVATNDIHYIDKADANAHDILLCIGTGKKKMDEKRMHFSTQEFYMKSEEEMKQLFKNYPESITNTLEVAQRCHLEIEFPGPLLPKSPVPPTEKDEKSWLTDLAHKGLENRYGKDYPKEYLERLEYELGVIIGMNFEGYFLIVRDYIFWAKQNGIPVGPGRGSGAGSIVAYCIDITDVDPMKYDLLFERFLNPERISMPDFDIDFCFEGRSKVIDHVIELYGKDRVGQIATFGTLKTKAVLKDVARVLDISIAESNQITKMIPDVVPDGRKLSIKVALEIVPELQEIKKRGGVYEELFDVASRLEGLSRHISVHAAGVVIGQKSLTNYVPLYKDPKTGAINTQYTKDVLEDCGLVKMDFLGLKTLTLIRNAENLVRKRKPDFDISRISDSDEATFKMFGEGDTLCVFQFESPGMQSNLRALKPNCIENLVAMNALYRPGPMANIPQYIDSKNGKMKIEYPDPDLEPVLKGTYGVIVYQEQVMKVAQVIAGYSLGQADILRKIMGKKKVELLAKEKVKFIEQAVKMGRDRQHVTEIFEKLEPFGKYGFNKSHSVAYAWIAYQTAFLKANYPVEFIAANLTNEINDSVKFNQYVTMAKQRGIEVLPPSVNSSDKNFNVVDGKIVYGLSGIKGVGTAVLESIIQERDKNGKYKDFMDFLRRSGSKVLNSKVLETLIKTGCFDFCEENRATLLYNISNAVDFVKEEEKDRESGQGSLFGDDEIFDTSFQMVEQEEFSFLEKLEFEYDMLGFYVSGHPLELHRKVWEKCVHIDIGKPESFIEGSEATVVGLVKEIHEITTKKNKKMAKVQLSDFNGSINLTIFTNLWDEIYLKLEEGKVYGFRGVFNKFRDEFSLTVNVFYDKPEALLTRTYKKMVMKVLKPACSEKNLEEISNILLSNQGNNTVELLLCESLDTNEDNFEENSDNDVAIKVVRHYFLGNEFNVAYRDKLIEDLLNNTAVIDAWYD